jgi:hypothetical protein
MSARPARADLPPLVARYVERNVPPGPLPARVRFAQAGQMQLKPGRWLRFEAEQEAATERVEFSWRARFPIAPLVALHVDDWYRAGDGALEVKLFGLPLKRSQGVDVARGEAMRYLAELPWVPHAFVANRELEWREVDANTVEVATTIVGSRRRCASTSTTTATSSPLPRKTGRAPSERLPCRLRSPASSATTSCSMGFGGRRSPPSAWELSDGPFVYFRGRITSFATA